MAKEAGESILIGKEKKANSPCKHSCFFICYPLNRDPASAIRKSRDPGIGAWQHFHVSSLLTPVVGVEMYEYLGANPHQREWRGIWRGEITEDANASKKEKVGAYLLLDNIELAEIHYERLTAEEQEELKLFPIFIFWNSSSEHS